jgi:pyruvate ferredoxin oxidoreductase beta subunit/2-oxoisovalerate ferredoxin oxidoreductase beta subunit
MAWAGDGGTFDIGLQSLSGAVERNEDFIYVCYDNEAYMNTGVQRSSATPYGTRTTTTPGKGWKRSGKKNIMDIMAAHRIPYAATASIAFPHDLVRKFKKAAAMRGGARFIHLYASCPTGWGIPSEASVKIARLAVQTNLFPLYEVEDGQRTILNFKGDLPVDRYLGLQGRFKHLSDDDVKRIQKQVDTDWQMLLQRVQQIELLEQPAAIRDGK